MGWSSRKRRAFRQSGLGLDALRSKQITAIKEAGADEAYALRGGVVDEAVLLGNIRKRRAAALEWLAQNPDRVLSQEAFELLETGTDMSA